MSTDNFNHNGNKGIDNDPDLFITGGFMNPQELYLSEITKDASSSSDSGVSGLDDLTELNDVDIADVTELNTFMDTDLKDIQLPELALDFSLGKEDQEDAFMDPSLLIKQEEDSSDDNLPSNDPLNLCVRNDVSSNKSGEVYSYDVACVKNEEINFLDLPAQTVELPTGQSGHDSYIIQTVTDSVPSFCTTTASPNFLHSPQSIHSPTSIPSPSFSTPPPTPPVCPSSQSLLAPYPASTVPYVVPAPQVPPRQKSYIVVPNVATVESGVRPLHPSVKPAAAVNISAILSSKIKIQPKPGAELSPTHGGQWFTPTSTTVPYPATSSVSTPSSVISANGITTITDEKSRKRAERIIKNRESASLSRKKKKEHLSQLEEQLRHYREENQRLLWENKSLKLNMETLQLENTRLRNTTGLIQTLTDHSAAKKICLMCLALVFSFSIIPYSIISPEPSPQVVHHIGRTLLSVPETDNVPFDSLSDSLENNAWSRLIRDKTLLMKFGQELNMTDGKNLTGQLGNMCPMYFNSTESIRLAEQLRGWMISQEEEKKSKEKKRPRKRAKDSPMRRFTGGTSVGLASGLSGEVKGTTVAGSNYPVQVFSGGSDARQQFLNAIPRRNDTFYVLSFSTDYFLVPATAHNKTMRPRMSLLFPVFAQGSVNESQEPEDSVGMMQIDCEILNTTRIHVQRSAFPNDAVFNSTSHEGSQYTHEHSPPGKDEKRSPKYWQNIRRSSGKNRN